MSEYKILILGASYGSLLGIKLALAGHTVNMVCLPVEADLINAEGARVRLPVRGQAKAIGLVPNRGFDPYAGATKLRDVVIARAARPSSANGSTSGHRAAI